jgi:hypothetical protein
LNGQKNHNIVLISVDNTGPARIITLLLIQNIIRMEIGMNTRRKTVADSSPRQHFLAVSNPRIIMGADEATNHDACCVQRSGEKGRMAERADQYNPPQNLNQHWYASITGGMPLGWYIVAVCCGTIVILLGLYPWGILLVLLSLPRDELSVLGRVSGRHGTPL